MPATKEQTNAALRYMLAQVGKPYIWGGTGPRGYDCSGLAWAGFKHAGVSIPRTTYTMMGGGRAVGASQIAPGDGLFPHAGHVVWYIGNGKVVEAARTGTDIRVRPKSSRDTRYAVRRFGVPGDAMDVSDGAVVNVASGAEFGGGITATIQKLLEPLAAFADSVTSKGTWIRFGLYAGGSALVLIGLSMMLGRRATKLLG